MVQHPVPRAPQNKQPGRPAKVADDEPELTPKQQQALAHSRGRICKKRGCDICAPLRETRRLKKVQRKAETQAQLHAKGQPCGRSNCPVPVCVTARHADPATPTSNARPAQAHAPAASGADELNDAASDSLRGQNGRHRAGLTCGHETCVRQECVDAFAHERARRHRARRPCKSADCTLAVCVSSRSNT
jgi:hypothetical protein